LTGSARTSPTTAAIEFHRADRGAAPFGSILYVIDESRAPVRYDGRIDNELADGNAGLDSSAQSRGRLGSPWLPNVDGELSDEHLRNMQALTDTALARLDVEDLLGELLDRVREILDADTAAVLLVEDASNELVARAARGIEEEVYQGVRVPLRAGFAGRIAAEQRPVVLDRVDETTVANPILWEKGIRAMLGVPLLTGDKLIGVLHVGTLQERSFTQADVELLELVGERVALATQTRLLEVERAASRLLERSLLPPRLPVCAGLDFAVRYVSAEGRDVGGDWYDLFVLPSGDLWVVAGDVAGHGLGAAVVMGRLRSTMRAYALLGLPAEEVLAMTDRKLLHFELGEMATVLCATSAPPFDQFRICCAGHPPPVIAVPGQPARPVPIDPDPPLGVNGDLRRSATPIGFPEGSLLVLYTDGLIERRDQSVDVGIERLCEAIPHAHPQVACTRIMGHLVGTNPPQDDIALVVIGRQTQTR
jgi:phosphoserine phosphatase RsbU/P